MRSFGTTARRVVLAILLTALIPLLAAAIVSRVIIARVSAAAFQPEFGAHLEQALGVYTDLARAVKLQMAAEADAIAASAPLGKAAAARDRAAAVRELERAAAVHPSLVLARVETCSGEVVAERPNGRAPDPAVERVKEERRVLAPAGGAAPASATAIECEEGQDVLPLVLVATFTTPRARFDELEEVGAFVETWKHMRSHLGEYVDQTYGNAYAALLAVTLLMAVATGVLVARPVTRRIARLVAATRPVAEGDLSVRVALDGSDEVADLGRAFDHMLEELDRSRARVEFLKRMSEWQKMARRLAHEIKNPLTPIQLAVEECHRRYRGDDAEYRRILQTTLEVVEEEVSSLRRLVGEFSSFARLPRAELAPADLGDFLREQRDRFAAVEPDRGGSDPEGDRALFSGVDVVFDVPDGAMPAALDGEMLHRVLGNVIRNSAQAIRDARAKGGPKRGNVRVSAATEEAHHVICIDDDGPGIPAEVAGAVFDPYVTTKSDGTGLGLSIVKKIIVDHGGTIDAGKSPLGGARFRIAIPRPDTAEARAALDQRTREADAPLSA